MLWNNAPGLSGDKTLDGAAFLDSQIDVLLHGIGVRNANTNPNPAATATAS